MGTPLGYRKLTSDGEKRLLCALRLGATRRLASEYAGITADTLLNYMHEDSEFSSRIKEAEADACKKWLQIINEAAPKSWQAAAWLAERKYPDEYGQRMRQDVTMGGSLRIVIESPDAEGKSK